MVGDDFIFQLPPGTFLPFELNNKIVKMSKTYTEGVMGGDVFTVGTLVQGKFLIYVMGLLMLFSE